MSVITCVISLTSQDNPILQVLLLLLANEAREKQHFRQSKALNNGAGT